jgi:hypothetical protein
MSLLDDASLLVTPNAEKAGKLYSIIPTNGNGDFSVTRATTATRTNASGLIESVPINEPRLDYSLGGCPNILLEPQRTNIALYSEDFADATWAKLRTTVTQNTTNSPDNTLDADTIWVSSSGQSYFGQSVTTTAGTVNVSIYCKYINQQFLQIYSSSAATAYANFDIQNGVVGDNGALASNIKITSAANGFYRISVALVVPAAAIIIRFAFVASSTSVYNPTEGIAGRQFYAWGAAIETGATGTAAYATTYIPTTNLSVTRVFDYMARLNLVTNGIVSATQGTWFMEIRNNLVLARDNSTTVFTFGADGNNGIRFRPTGTGRIAVEKVVGGVITVLVSAVNATETMKVAFKWNGSEVETFLNGVQQTPLNKTYPSTIVPQSALLNFTSTNPGVPIYINEMGFFPTQLTDSQCIAITT